MRRSSEVKSLTLKSVCYAAFLILILELSGIEAGNSWFNFWNLIHTPRTKDRRSFLFATISDLDEESPVLKVRKGKLKPNGDLAAYLREGILVLTRTGLKDRPFNVTIEMDPRKGPIENKEILSRLAYDGRGMEMSTLTHFNDKFYACDDKTGVVYQLPITGNPRVFPIPWVILSEGPDQGPKGFKCEWSTIKDGKLVIGGHGVGRKSNSDKYVKFITPEGVVSHVNWTSEFKIIADALDVHLPGYVANEAIGWSDYLAKWIILPRKVSKVTYNLESYEHTSGSNKYLIADEDFKHIEVKEIGNATPSHGFSAFAFVPTTHDFVIVALKSVEVEEITEGYIMAFDLAGNILFPETKFAAQKYEGIEFLNENEE